MTDLRQAAQQALEALEAITRSVQTEDAITALRTALEQQAEPVQENKTLIEWKERGEAIMAQAGVGFRLGAWWADRPWRPEPDRRPLQAAGTHPAPCAEKEVLK